jgi:hypothetical protein
MMAVFFVPPFFFSVFFITILTSKGQRVLLNSTIEKTHYKVLFGGIFWN